MKRHILVIPKKAVLYRDKNIVVNENDYNIKLFTYSNNSGFVHIASISKNNVKIADAKAQYYNRTWERFTGESVYKESLNYAIKSNDIARDEKTLILEKINQY